MGFLKGYNSITSAAGHRPPVASREMLDAFQLTVFNLIGSAYKTIRTPGPFEENPDETLISVSLFDAVKIIASRDGIPCSVTPERYEYTDQIREGIKSTLTAKRYDLYIENWDVIGRIEYGVEAKILTENNFKNRVATTLIKDYVSDKGMGKFINKLYDKRGVMVGYIVEGSNDEIIKNINTQVTNHFDAAQILQPVVDNQVQHEQVYRSQHLGKIDYDLYHLMLDFG